MKVLFINYEFPPVGGGGGATSMFLAKHLAKKGVEIKILTAAHHSLPLYEKKDGYEVIRIRGKRKNLDRSSIFEMFIFTASAIIPVLRITRKWNPDLLHIFFGHPTGLLGLIAKFSLKKPYIISLLGGDVPGFFKKELKFIHTALKPFTKIIWRKAAYVAANSNGLQTLAQKSFPDIKIGMIPNGVDHNDFSQKKEGQTGVIKILFVGRFVEQKGLHILLQALSTIEDYPIQTTVIGDGPLKKSYEKFISQNNLIDKVNLAGWIPLTRLAEFYRSHDILVLPSINEGMPSVILQAMACGMPIIASRIAGNEDLIIPKKNGKLIEAGNVIELRKALLDFISNPGEIQKMGEFSYKLSLRYDWGKIASEYYEIYTAATL